MSFKSTVESMSNIMDQMGIVELQLERQILFGLYRKHIHLSKRGSETKTIQVAQKDSLLQSPTDVQKIETNNSTNKTIKSNMVGVVYFYPEPNSEPFITKGKHVKKGDTIVLIEAMKTFNPIKAEFDCVIKDILVKDGDIIEFDQPIVTIE